MMTSIWWYYWSDTYKNDIDENFQNCLKKYGVVDSLSHEKGMETPLLYTDGTQSYGNSWL